MVALGQGLQRIAIPNYVLEGMICALLRDCA